MTVRYSSTSNKGLLFCGFDVFRTSRSDHYILTHYVNNYQPRSQGFSLRTRRDTRKPWSGPVTCLPKKWQYLTATREGVARYSLMKYTSLRNKLLAKRLLNRYQFMCRAKFGTNQLKSMKSMFSKIFRYFWRFSTTGKAASKLHLGFSMQVVVHTKFAFSRLEQYDYCYI